LKRLLLYILIFTVASLSIYPQVVGVKSNNTLSGRWVVTAEGGITYSYTDFKKSMNDFYVRVMGEYFFPTTNRLIFGLRLQSGFGKLKGGGDGISGYNYDAFQSQIIILGGGLNISLAVSDAFVLYYFGGTSLLHFDPRELNGNKLPNNAAGAYSKSVLSIQGELGFRYLFSKSVSFNLSGAVNFQGTDELDDVVAGVNDDAFYTLTAGFSFYFGGFKDSDKDGVDDEYDACPETPQGVIVDEYGCPIDSDGDGVPDYLDRCPETLPNITVNRSGCPVDSDGDGVPDYLDECSNTPRNISVDIRGCPADEDQDGVADYRDNCPGTPIGTEVDKFGCEIKVAEPELPEITSFILTGDINFEVGKSYLLPAAKNTLDKLITVLREHPRTKWRIEGHTDNTGPYRLNDRISYERAAAVADYLILNGIDKSRLQAIGYGPDRPIADNSTVTGRALNRRVTIEMVGVGEDFQEYDELPNVGSEFKYNSALDRHVGSLIYTDGRTYCYQVSSWSSYTKAQNELRRLIARGYDAFIVEARNIPGLDGTWYRIRIGYFNSIAEANRNRNNFIE